MNTKASVTVGWIAYTVAFLVGGGYAINRYWNAPGGRREREEAADRARAQDAARELLEEERIRSQKALPSGPKEPLSDANAHPQDPRRVEGM